MESTTTGYTTQDYLQLSKALTAVENVAWSENALRKAREALMTEPASDRCNDCIEQINRALDGSPDGFSLGDVAVHFYYLSTGCDNWTDSAATPMDSKNKLGCIPPDATHFQVIYGQLEFFRRTEGKRFNNVSEEWQSTLRWAYWDRDQWKDAEAGFSSRLCELIGDLP